MAGGFELTTERLRVRPLADEDLPAFAAYRSDPNVARFQSWDVPYPLDAARALLAEQDGVAVAAPGAWVQLAIADRDGGALLGDCAVHGVADLRDTAEIGFTLAPAARGRGIAAEAVGALVGALFGDLRMHRVIAQIDERNAPARRLVERLGFRLEARFVDADWFKGEWTTLCVYAVLAVEWPRASVGA